MTDSIVYCCKKAIPYTDFLPYHYYFKNTRFSLLSI